MKEVGKLSNFDFLQATSRPVAATLVRRAPPAAARRGARPAGGPQPAQRVRAGEAFADFLRALEEGRCLPHAVARASEASFAKVWDNDEDAAYDRM
ncbi:MAG TPA: hypothetical protein P5163_12395 [Rubrivivax sp.]|nr:hypothetical protein [Rubrivivax sp.]